MSASNPIIKFNKVQQFLVNEFKDDLNELHFEKLKTLIADFLNETSVGKSVEDSVKTNWVGDKIYNEMLNHAVRQLTKGYFKMAYHFSSHPDVPVWNTKEREWREYGSNIKNMIIESKEGIQQEIDRILDEYKEVMEIEKKISR